MLFMESCMTDEEWWDEFGECSCEQCAESTEIQAERERLKALGFPKEVL